MHFRLQQLSLASLLASSSLLQAEPAPLFTHEDIQAPGKDCRIQQFACGTCGHVIDDQNWDEQNRWRADVEQCAKQNTGDTEQEKK